MTFAVNRFEMNKGCGVHSGSWEYEEFMFSDSVFGYAHVRYKVSGFREEYGNCHGWSTISQIDIKDPFVESLKVFDDDGNEVELSPEARADAEKMVLEAFRDNEVEVLAFEKGC